jgi:hypothetical protein
MPSTSRASSRTTDRLVVIAAAIADEVALRGRRLMDESCPERSAATSTETATIEAPGGGWELEREGGRKMQHDDVSRTSVNRRRLDSVRAANVSRRNGYRHRTRRRCLHQTPTADCRNWPPPPPPVEECQSSY